MRYLLVLCMIGFMVANLGLFEQGRRYVLADHGQDIAMILKNHAADPLEGRIHEFVVDEKVANLIRTVLQSNSEEKKSLAGAVRDIHASLKEGALFDGAIWAVQVVILAIVFGRLNDARRGKRPLEE